MGTGPGPLKRHQPVLREMMSNIHMKNKEQKIKVLFGRKRKALVCSHLSLLIGGMMTGAYTLMLMLIGCLRCRAMDQNQVHDKAQTGQRPGPDLTRDTCFLCFNRHLSPLGLNYQDFTYITNIYIIFLY